MTTPTTEIDSVDANLISLENFPHLHKKVVYADFARKLERERDEARATESFGAQARLLVKNQELKEALKMHEPLMKAQCEITETIRTERDQLRKVCDELVDAVKSGIGTHGDSCSAGDSCSVITQGQAALTPAPKTCNQMDARMKNSILTPVSPDSGHPFLRDADGGATFGGSTEQKVCGVPNHSGMTRSERIAAGFMQAGDHEWLEDQDAQHEAWKSSPAGQAWLRAQPWFNQK